MAYRITAMIILYIMIFSACGSQNSLYQKEITGYQQEIQEEYSQPDTTPLSEEEMANFKGIQFFPIHEKYKVRAIFQAIDEDSSTIPFQTSSGKIKYYKKYGLLFFNLKGNANQVLTLYEPQTPIKGHEGYLFLPFWDTTNGESSYGGGRYLDFHISDIQHNSLIIDFNKAYNPYCAYSKGYSCPIPPESNRLSFPIKAGVSYTPLWK